MAHFAHVINNVVQKVIVVNNDVLEKDGKENEQNGVIFCKTLYGDQGSWIQCSYNTHGNTHKKGGTALRGNFPNREDTYDSTNDVFYAPKPADNYTLNEETWLWEEDE